MYIAYNKKTKRVIGNPSEKPFITMTEDVMVCEVEKEAIPQNYDYLMVDNVKEHTRVVKEAYTEEIVEFNEETQQEETKLVEHPQVTETYYDCDLIAKFREYTAEQLEKQKQSKYESLVEQYIRQEYSISQELSILRQRYSKVEEFNNYNNYAEYCKAKAKLEVYGY